MFAQIPPPPVSSTDWLSIGKMIGEFVVGLLVAYSTYRTQKMAKVVDDVHTLSNSSMGAQKKLTLDLSEAKAMLQPTPENQEAARVARADWMAHQTKQAIVDAGGKT